MLLSLAFKTRKLLHQSKIFDPPPLHINNFEPFLKDIVAFFKFLKNIQPESNHITIFVSLFLLLPNLLFQFLLQWLFSIISLFDPL